ncbi:MAG TPA: glutamyl-tRNA reductase [Acidisarcina sp.]
MSIVILGVNHRTAPVEVREQLAIGASRLAEATSRLLGTRGVREGMILSTCNRVELLTSQEGDGAGMQFLEEYFDLPAALLEPHLYEYREREAVRHVFRVAASLDSMVVGEPQILGQVKESYSVARSVGAVQSNLERLMQCAFTVAKRVRTETQIGSSSVSIASVAVELAQKIFGSLAGKTVFLVGAGKMSELAARHLLAHGATSIFVTNRTHDRAVRLAGAFNGQAIPFEELHKVADQADIIITSTGSPHVIFRREHGQQFLQRRRNRPMFFIDIAVPRDVDPDMNRVDGAFLYDIDDLQTVAGANMADRGLEAAQAEEIVAREVERYHQRGLALDAVPTIVGLQRQTEQMRQMELRRAQSRLLSLTAEQQAAVEALTRGLMNKFLHLPMQAVKNAAKSGDAATVEAIRSAFDLAAPEAIAAPGDLEARAQADAEGDSATMEAAGEAPSTAAVLGRVAASRVASPEDAALEAVAAEAPPARKTR